jgi:hypothetical protein
VSFGGGVGRAFTNASIRAHGGSAPLTTGTHGAIASRACSRSA